MPESGLKLFDYAMIIAYLLFTFGIAIWFGRKQKSTDDFFVGGRRMPWFAVGLSILATLFSTLSYLGSPGEVVKNGLGVFAGYMAIPFAAVVILMLWVPFFMRLKLTSAYEYLELRFSYSVRLIGATLFVLLRLGWMSMVVYAASLALDRVKGPDITWLPGKDIYWWICMVGVIAAIYTSVGGIQAMIWTDVLQCLLLLAGVLLAISYVVFTDGTGPVEWFQTAGQMRADEQWRQFCAGTQEGPVPWWQFTVNSELPIQWWRYRLNAHPGPQEWWLSAGFVRTAPAITPVFSLDLTVRVTIVTAMINYFFWNICTHGSDQVVLQRYFSVSSLKNARRSYFTNLLVDFTMAALLALAGLALLSFYLRRQALVPDGLSPMQAADKLFPHFLGAQLPAGGAGLVIAAFLCDAIQTLESGVNSITAVVTNDLVPKLRHGGKRMLSDLTVARLLSITITVLVTANAYFVANRNLATGETLIGMMPQFFNMFVGPLAAMFMIGMFLPRCTSRSVLPAVILGFFVTVFWSWGPEIAHLFGRTLPKLTFTLAIAAPCLTTIGTAAILSYIVETGKPHPGLQWTWWCVVRGRPDVVEDRPDVAEV